MSGQKEMRLKQNVVITVKNKETLTFKGHDNIWN